MKVSIEGMSRREKWALMEALWIDLSRDPDSIPSPAWHAKELAKTKRDVKAGKEKFVPWETAKEKLLAGFEKKQMRRKASRSPRRFAN